MKILYDVEVYKNVFLCTIMNYDTNEKTIWEISTRKNDLEQVKEFFNTFKGFLVSFNGIHYDNCIILYLISIKFTTVEEFLLKIKAWSDHIITTERWWSDRSLSKYKYHNRWIDVDLFLYWAKSLRISKKISLKGLAIQLGYHTVQELPFDPGMELNYDQIDELAHYNSVHDIDILKLLLETFEEKTKVSVGNLGTVDLRQYVSSKYHVNAYSWDVPKIASEILLIDYCNAERLDPKEVRNTRHTYGAKLPLPAMDFKLKQFKSLYEEMSKAERSFDKEIVLLEGNTAIKLTYGKGGIHSVNRNETYEEDNLNYILTSDASSMYPNGMINHQLFRFNSVLKRFTEMKDERVEAKKNKEKSKDALFKLILNGTSGLLDQEYSWLYYPEGAMKLRLLGQLVITLVIERLVLAGFQVLSANTDGIECIVPKNRLEEYYQIVNQVGTETNLNFEHQKYKKIVYANVNNYIALTEDNKIKQKGSYFLTEPELGNSVDYLVIPKALQAWYIDGVKPEDFVVNHKNVLDFCCSQKVDKSYHIMWTDRNFVSKKQQRLNRFYASTKGGYIYKCRDGKQSHLMKQSGVTIYNNHKEDIFPDDINYKFYISQIKTIINQIKNNNQLQLF